MTLLSGLTAPVAGRCGQGTLGQLDRPAGRDSRCGGRRRWAIPQLHEAFASYALDQNRHEVPDRAAQLRMGGPDGGLDHLLAQMRKLVAEPLLDCS